jgi:hypothetical protein
MIIVSVTAGTFSFAASTSKGGAQSTTTNTTTTTAKRVPSQITTKTTNPVAPVVHNATLKSGMNPCSGGTAGFLWDHVYAVDNGNYEWSRPNSHSQTPSRLNTINDCITVTGWIYSQTGGGTNDDEDGDLHFTLTLDPKDKQYSNSADPTCTPSHGLPNPCYNIIVEVICHKDHGATPTTPKDYKKQWGDYCNGVNPEYPYGQFPSQGEHLSVSGRLVEDKDNHNWREIHPAFDIHKT